MKDNKYIKISPWPFIVIIVLIAGFIFAGSIWDKSRTAEKLTKLQTTAERIYKAREQDFIKLLNTPNFDKPSQELLQNINQPEKGIYMISLIKKQNTNWSLYEGNGYSWPYARNLAEEEKTNFEKVKNDNETTSTEEKIIKEYWQDSLFTIIPVKENGKTIGFVIIEIRKTENI